MTIRLPPIQCLVTFEPLCRLRSVTLNGEELNVTPSAVFHRIKQLVDILDTRLFGRDDFSLTSDGNAYLARVREGLTALQDFPSFEPISKRRRLTLAALPTFARTILLPRLQQIFEACPEIGLAVQLSSPQAHRLCLRPGTLDWRERSAFAEWLKKTLVQSPPTASTHLPASNQPRTQQPLPKLMFVRPSLSHKVHAAQT